MLNRQTNCYHKVSNKNVRQGKFSSPFPLPSSLSPLRPAFTLAEVLITLGIIGVVAALTIPILIHNFQDTQLKTSFKKVYANLSQAVSQTTAENGGVPYACYSSPAYVYSTSECTEFWSSFKTKLNVIKEYSGRVDGINIPDYTGTDLIVAQGGHNNNSSCTDSQTGGKYAKTAWTFADGSMLWSWHPTLEDWGQYIFVDTNGLKKPNKWGYDIFVLDFLRKTTTSSVTIDDKLCGSQEKGGYNVIDLLTN